MPTEFTAQNGAVLKQTTKVAVTACPKAKKKAKKHPRLHVTKKSRYGGPQGSNTFNEGLSRSKAARTAEDVTRPRITRLRTLHVLRLRTPHLHGIQRLTPQGDT